MRTFIAMSALLLFAGCQQSSPAPTVAPAPEAPAAQGTALIIQKPTAGKEKKFPLDQEQFKAGAMNISREEVHAKYGEPQELGDWGAAVGWDGPVSIYHGPFTSEGGEKAKARVYFGRVGGESKAANVEFTNQ